MICETVKVVTRRDIEQQNSSYFDVYWYVEQIVAMVQMSTTLERTVSTDVCKTCRAVLSSLVQLRAMLCGCY